MSKVTQIRQRARDYLQKGKFDKAIEEYKRLTGLETKNPNFFNEMGDIYLKAGDSIQAVSSFEKAVVNYQKVALYNNAVAVCKKILRIVPKRVETIYKLGELRAKQKLEGEAKVYFSQFLDCLIADGESLGPEVNEKLCSIMELVPENEGILSKVATIFAIVGIKTSALEIFSKLYADTERAGDEEKCNVYRQKIGELKRSMTSDEIQSVERSLEHMGAGEAAGERDAGEPGIQDTEEAVEVGPVPPSDAAKKEEPVEQHLGADEPATEDEKPSPAEQPALPDEKADLDAHEELPEPEEPAQEHAIPPDEVSASASEPEDTAPSYADIDETEQGVSEREETAPPERAVATDGGEPRKDFKNLLQDDKGADSAENIVEEITSDVEEDDYRSHYDLGLAYLEMALYTEAVKEFQIASRSDQLQIKSIEMIGHCFLQQNNPRLAVKQLLRGLELVKVANTDNLGVHYNIGLAYEMLGDLERAREHFEEVYIVDISFRDVADKMKKFSTVS